MFPLGWLNQLLGLAMNGIDWCMYHLLGVHNVGWCIVIFTLFVYILMYPLNAKQQKSSRLMNKINPEIKSIQKKYKNKKDQASQMKMNQETQDIYAKYGKIDILVNNAGVCRLETFENTSFELRDFHLDINIKGTWNVTKAVLPYMKKSTHGSIINLSSVTGPMVADSGEVAYATTKAALIGFTKALAQEVVKDSIRVNAIMPGYIMTPMVEGMAKETNASDPSSVIAGIAKAIPMQRLGTIKELGELAAFLASEESSYITGQGIVIDGGSTLPETMTMGV